MDADHIAALAAAHQVDDRLLAEHVRRAAVEPIAEDLVGLDPHRQL